MLYTADYFNLSQLKEFDIKQVHVIFVLLLFKIFLWFMQITLVKVSIYILNEGFIKLFFISFVLGVKFTEVYECGQQKWSCALVWVWSAATK